MPRSCGVVMRPARTRPRLSWFPARQQLQPPHGRVAHGVLHLIPLNELVKHCTPKPAAIALVYSVDRCAAGFTPMLQNALGRLEEEARQREVAQRAAVLARVKQICAESKIVAHHRPNLSC